MKRSIITRILVAMLAILIAVAFVGCSKTQECNLCKKSFEAADHNAHKSGDGTVYICDDCENAAKETTPEPEPETEPETEPGPQECKICKETFEAKKHNAHKSADGIVYICDNCDGSSK